MNPVIVCIQARHGKRLECRPCVEQLSCLFVCVCLICAWDNDQCYVMRWRTITLSPLPSFPLITPTNRLFHTASVRLHTGLVSFTAAEFQRIRPCSKYLLASISVFGMEASQSISIGSIGKLCYRSHPNDKLTVLFNRVVTSWPYQWSVCSHMCIDGNA